MASFNLSSFLGVRQCLTVAAIVCCIILCVTMTTTALPLEDVVGQAMEMARQQQHREKRAVTMTNCEQPSNLEDMFRQINSGLTSMQYLQNAVNGEAVSVPEGEQWIERRGDLNEDVSCPSTLTTDPDAPLAHRLLCPFYFNILTLPRGYYPPTLQTAKCKCNTCINNDSFACEAVTSAITILKPVGCFQGLQKYQEEVVHISTSCTCASCVSTETTTDASGYGDV